MKLNEQGNGGNDALTEVATDTTSGCSQNFVFDGSFNDDIISILHKIL